MTLCWHCGQPDPKAPNTTRRWHCAACIRHKVKLARRGPCNCSQHPKPHEHPYTTKLASPPASPPGFTEGTRRSPALK